MKTLGLIGGMSWESTAIYYRHINEITRQRLGGLHSARLLLWSFDFAKVAERQHVGDWQGAADLMIEAARKLEDGGAEGLVICTNTMHRMANEVQAAISIPLLHIADATAKAIVSAGVKRPALLATRFTMEQDFYKERLRAGYGIDAVVPDERGRAIIHRVIYEELCLGIVSESSKAAYLSEIERLRRENGADGVIMGCTEITMLIGQGDVDIPVFDTTLLHAGSAVDFALA
ncbi:aspartate/glutamate racemase family protein [Microvirga alba]|uniref:Aspartate/glutamate racemase family protein n=1 Tax=Microvirga alba TaxID=2791025 RepID=A0A931FLQ1_9HYPH|nr:aspartate/glutamate racemase family protein [Microvirga alba]MBF9232339.1 aspartate/glutamate racemase family protein [Microvirga alba]